MLAGQVGRNRRPDQLVVCRLTQEPLLPDPPVDEVGEVAIDEPAREGGGVRDRRVAAVPADQLPERGVRNGALEVEMQFDLWQALEPVATDRQIDAFFDGHSIPSRSV